MFEPVATELAAALLEERQDLEQYPDAVAHWAETEARAQLLRQWIADQGIFDDEGAPRSGALQWLRAFEGQAVEARKVLGLDPRAHAELVKSRAEATSHTFDVQALMAQGRQALEARAETSAAGPGSTGSVLGGAVGDAALGTDGGEGIVDGVLPAPMP